ncbi:MAG: OB-fold domain-containing protein [Acidimicrobiia bacterium]|nr:OB-fold domain-containing protein [Acidimicrobiia bacterium]
MNDRVERLDVPILMDEAWHYASGEAMERFSTGLAARRIEALRCDGCGRRYLPPRPMCGNCRLRMTHWVAVDDTGTLEAWTVVHQPILDGRTGEERPSPYGMGLIRLDGADTTVNHFVQTGGPRRQGVTPPGPPLFIGQRVRAVWREELRGAMDDILHFEVVEP